MYVFIQKLEIDRCLLFLHSWKVEHMNLHHKNLTVYVIKSENNTIIIETK